MRLLVAEDDSQVARFIVKGFREARFSVDHASTGEDALHLASGGSYDAVVLDIMLPGLDGYEVVNRLRSQGNRVPVIFLTAKDRIEEKVRGLELGGDDYLAKPFAFVELLARVRALLRRKTQEDPQHVLTFEDMRMELLSRRVQRAGRALDLTNKEFDLLEFFLRRPGQVLTRTMIAEHVWDIRFDCDSNLVDVHLARLRKKMEEAGEPRLIQTIKGVGYVLRSQ